MATHSARIDIWFLVKRMLIWLIVPLVVAIVIDHSTGLWPVVTLVGAAFIVPLAGVFVSRAAVAEMERVVQEVAPDPETAVPEEETAVATILEGA